MEQGQFVDKAIEELQKKLHDMIKQEREIHGGGAPAQRLKHQLQNTIKKLKKEYEQLRSMKARK